VKRRGRPRSRDSIRELDFDTSDVEESGISSDDRAELDADLRRMSVAASTGRYATGYLDPL
jgi:hypothetical protein